MISHTIYFKGMMVFTLTSQMYHRISVLVPVLVQVPEYLSTSTSTSTSTMTLELTSTSTVWVPEIQHSSTASTSTEYEYPSPEIYGIWSWGLVDPYRRLLIHQSINQSFPYVVRVNDPFGTLHKYCDFSIFRLIVTPLILPQRQQSSFSSYHLEILYQ